MADRGAGNTTVISIHSLRMEGDRFVVPHMRQTDISIHSLRMEGDSGLRHLVTNFGISIHSLRMEGDPSSVRKDLHGGNFNPLPPHGGRLIHHRKSVWKDCISIHSLRMEGDPACRHIIK